MKLPDRVKAIRTRYAAKFGLPHGTPETIDDIARQWSIGFAEQVRFETMDAKWGMKRADPGRPIGKDSIAFNDPAGLICWDLFTGTGTGSPGLNDDPDSLAIGPGTPDGGHDGQVFVPVQAVDHIGQVSTPPVPVPSPKPGKTLSEYFAERDVIVRLYHEELGRGVIADPDALVNWLYHWREWDQSEAWIRARIQDSPEWKLKHP